MASNSLKISVAANYEFLEKGLSNKGGFFAHFGNFLAFSESHLRRHKAGAALIGNVSPNFPVTL